VLNGGVTAAACCFFSPPHEGNSMIDLSPSRTRRVVVGYSAQLHASQAITSSPNNRSR
jgi:hypothetical protein